MASRESSQATASAPEKGSGSTGRRLLCARKCANCARPTSVEQRGESSGRLLPRGSIRHTERSQSRTFGIAKLAYPRDAFVLRVDGRDCVVCPLIVELAFQEFPKKS